MLETGESSLSPESTLVDILRQFIRQEVRAALAELAPPPIVTVPEEAQRELLQHVLTQPYHQERIVIGEPNATITPVQWQEAQEVPIPTQHASQQDRARIAAEVSRRLAQQARMQGVGRLASAAGVSSEEAEHERAREEEKR